jgi:hypothetical protein
MIENQALRPLVEAFEKKYPSSTSSIGAAIQRAMVQKLPPSSGRAHRRRHLRTTGGAGWQNRGRVAADLVAVGRELSVDHDRSRRMWIAAAESISASPTTRGSRRPIAEDL